MSKSSENRLQYASSPYLKQHAHNPVDWYPWGQEALDKAASEDKPLIVSIGYSSCHWCHVMERESFENQEIAELMNEYFICIKVDREERPDIDQIYMEAVQAMGIHGGWPLNVFLTPGQKPFYGGTYFPAASWKQLLRNVTDTYANKKRELMQSADSITGHLRRSDVARFGLEPVEQRFSKEVTVNAAEKLAGHFDTSNGGLQKAPKFPMPAIWQFLLRSGQVHGKENLTEHVLFTLEKMAAGGIYDQVGGGFARYSVDERWFAPHFEKMLYDNGQLISLYAEAFRVSPNPLFREVVYNSMEFLKRELMRDDGGLYDALDADSEGVEGKFYTWNREEINKVLGEQAELWTSVLGISDRGNWENERNILIRKKSIPELAAELKIPEAEALSAWNDIRKKLLSERGRRVRPGLDNKILAGWNGIALQGMNDAYKTFHEKTFLEMAELNAAYLLKNHIRKDVLYRTAGPGGISGYLDDYAFVIRGFTSLYESTFHVNWLEKARQLMKSCLAHFFDPSESLFFYTDDRSEKLISRKKEIFDNVIPASNSAMAYNLWMLGKYYDNDQWTGTAEQMMNRVSRLLAEEPEYLANWGSTYLMMTGPFAEIAFVGPDAGKLKREFDNHYYPNCICYGTTSRSDLPLLEDKKIADDTTAIYVCYDKACKLPVKSIPEAIQQLA